MGGRRRGAARGARSVVGSEGRCQHKGERRPSPLRRAAGRAAEGRAERALLLRRVSLVSALGSRGPRRQRTVPWPGGNGRRSQELHAKLSGVPGRQLSPRRARTGQRAPGPRVRSTAGAPSRPAAPFLSAEPQVSARPAPGPRAVGTRQREVALFSSLALQRCYSFDILTSAALKRE